MSALPSLDRRAVLVTGASSGIGRATAVELVRRGARVAVNYPVADSAEAARTTLHHAAEALRSADSNASPEVRPEAGGADARLLAADGTTLALTVRADVSNANEVESMFARVHEAFGGLDVLVNNAGIQLKAATHEVEIEDFDRVIAVNLRGAFLCARAALRRWLGEPRTAERPGVIVNVSSVHEQIPRPQFTSYAISKFGMKGMTQSLALEYAAHHIRVNAVGPGATITAINDAWRGDPAAREAVAEHIPMKRVAEPEEMARVIAFLAADAAPYMTGQTLFVDGGLTLYPAFQEPWSG